MDYDIGIVGYQRAREEHCAFRLRLSQEWEHRQCIPCALAYLRYCHYGADHVGLSLFTDPESLKAGILSFDI